MPTFIMRQRFPLYIKYCITSEIIKLNSLIYYVFERFETSYCAPSTADEDEVG